MQAAAQLLGPLPASFPAPAPRPGLTDSRRSMRKVAGRSRALTAFASRLARNKSVPEGGHRVSSPYMPVVDGPGLASRRRPSGRRAGSSVASRSASSYRRRRARSTRSPRVIAQKLDDKWKAAGCSSRNKPVPAAISARSWSKIGRPNSYTPADGLCRTQAINPSLYASLPYDSVRTFSRWPDASPGAVRLDRQSRTSQ